MSSYLDFKNFVDMSQPEGSGGKPGGNFPLARQSSVYSLTFDELQNTFSGIGKDFGSMNMDELLKNIWTAEETQTVGPNTGVVGGNITTGNLQKQGSLTLPRTLSQKTVDEVWRDLFRESGDGGAKDGSVSTIGGSKFQQREPTFGEMTLEEFLSRAGVVGEATQPISQANNGGFYGDISQPNSNNSTLSFGFQQPAQNNGSMASQIIENKNVIPNSSPNLALNLNAIRSSQQPPYQQQQQPILPKQATLAFASPMQFGNNAELSSPRTMGPITGMKDPSVKASLVQGVEMKSGVIGIQSEAMGMAGLSTGATKVAVGSPMNQLPTNLIPKSNLDTSSLSPSPYSYGEATRTRKNGTLEKVVERRRRRMIKNRESAARSRARKQVIYL